jgi:hypothetical protein
VAHASACRRAVHRPLFRNPRRPPLCLSAIAFLTKTAQRSSAL